MNRNDVDGEEIREKIKGEGRTERLSSQILRSIGLCRGNVTFN